MNTYVIFEIDNPTDLHQVAKFTRLIDTKRAMGELQGTMIPAIGCYKGVINQSYIMRQDDFEAHVLNSGYVSDQESFLYVSQLGKYPGHYDVAKLVGGRIAWEDRIGKVVKTDRPQDFDGWTYRPDLNIYFAVA